MQQRSIIVQRIQPAVKRHGRHSLYPRSPGSDEREESKGRDQGEVFERMEGDMLRYGQTVLHYVPFYQRGRNYCYLLWTSCVNVTMAVSKAQSNTDVTCPYCNTGYDSVASSLVYKVKKHTLRLSME